MRPARAHFFRHATRTRASGPLIRRVIALAVLAAVFLLPLADRPVLGATKVRPLPVEKLTFDLSWGILPVGTAVIETTPNATYGDAPAMLFTITAHSNAFVDLFFKIRDKLVSYTDKDLSRSLHYRKNFREGSRRRDFKLDFDWKDNYAEYRDFQGKVNRVPLPRPTFDPLGVFFRFRAEGVAGRSLLTEYVTDGLASTWGALRILGKEKVSVPYGEFEAFHTEVNLRRVDGIFRTGGDSKYYVWAMTNGTHIPLKLTSDVVIGGFTGTLTGELSEVEIGPAPEPEQ